MKDVSVYDANEKRWKVKRRWPVGQESEGETKTTNKSKAPRLRERYENSKENAMIIEGKIGRSCN